MPFLVELVHVTPIAPVTPQTTGEGGLHDTVPRHLVSIPVTRGIQPFSVRSDA